MLPERSRPLLLATLLLNPSWAHAADTASEWRCAPSADGQGWACEAAPVAPGPYRLPALHEKSDATPTPGQASRTTAAGPAAGGLAAPPMASAADLGWQPRKALPPETLSRARECCAGAYVDPLAGIDRSKAGRPEDAPLKVSADEGQMQEDNGRFVLKGGVEFTQGYRQGHSDRAVVERNQDRITLEGNVILREPGNLLRADRAEINTADGTGLAHNVQYVSFEKQTRASAQVMERPADGVIELTDTQYTTCEPPSQAWDITADHIQLDQNTGIGTAEDAVLHLQEIPVAWIPYIAFPIDDRRMTGFLWPHLGHSNRSGTDIAVPYYLNLAPNFDATLGPRYLSNRGPMLELETRYQTPVDEWTLGLGYLGSDNQYVKDRIDQRRTEWQQISDDYLADPINNPAPPPLSSIYNVEDRDRWIVTLQETGNLSDHWRSRIDYTRVSDKEYLRDLDTISIEARRQTHLDEMAQLLYNSDNWRFTATVQDYQTIGYNNTKQYAQLPHLELEHNTDNESFHPQWLLLADYSYFAHDEKIRGQRLYAEPGITFPMRWNAGFLQPTIKVRHVNYALPGSNETGAVYNYAPLLATPPGPAPVITWPDDPAFTAPKAGSDITGRPSATVPMFSLDGGLYFERDLTWGGSQYLQTLEPRVYYLYAPYEKQDNLPNFDTGEVDFSYQRLFSESRFNGYDRLDDANQTSVGILSRFVDQQTGRDIVTLGAGQIFYNRDLKVSTTPGANYETRPYSEIAAVAGYTPTDNVTVIADISWDPDTNKTSEGGLRAQWQPAEFWIMNLGYRYRRENPTLVAGSCLLGLPAAQRSFDWTCDYTNEDLHQTDFSAVFPLNYQWRLFTKLHYDITHHESLETLGGVEYESCCWMVRLVYQESLDGALDVNNNNFIASDELQRNYAFYVQFQLKGLGDLADKLDNLLDNAIPGFDKLYGIQR